MAEKIKSENEYFFGLKNIDNGEGTCPAIGLCFLEFTNA